MASRTFVCLLASIVGAGCAAQSGDGVDTSSEALTDFAGQAGIVEGSSEAAAIRTVVNDSTLLRSDYSSTIGLASATADAIIAKRPFTSLAQLDALPLANAAMFVKLQTYARSTNARGLIKGSDRAIPVTAGQNHEIEQWGRGLWEGFVSYTVSINRADLGDVHLADALGGTYPLTTTPTQYQRLPLPVRLVSSVQYNGYVTVSLSNVAFEVLKTNPIQAQSLTGKYSGTSSLSLSTVGADIPGVQMTLTASAGFFLNFTNGDACATLQIRGADGAVHALNPQSTSDQITATAPLNLSAQSTCISARLPQGQSENGDADFNLQLSAITLGDPR